MFRKDKIVYGACGEIKKGLIKFNN